jgi:hypothetical protein
VHEVERVLVAMNEREREIERPKGLRDFSLVLVVTGTRKKKEQ